MILGVINMNIIVCLDKDNGMMFNERRQSQDSVLREKVLLLSAGSTLWMNEYTAKQFESGTPIKVDEDFLTKANPGDFCFVENSDIPVENVEKFYIFLWNRKYPGDRFFEIDLKKNGFKKIETEDFTGKSHDKITLEIYAR